MDNMLLQSGRPSGRNIIFLASFYVKREPATFPRVSHLSLISDAFPWVIEVYASSADHDVTCSDVLQGLHEGIKKTIGRAKFESLPKKKQEEISERYHRNRSTHGPGYELGEGIKRVDYLCDKKLGVAGKGWRKEEGKKVPWPAVFVVHLDVEPTRVPEDVRFERTDDAARDQRRRERNRQPRREQQAPSEAETETATSET
ncbi:hypothetical protein M422DRAFT_273770 [Sphaerobolus stellatus SS14]|uniref:Unplaced genomic scaffold SPHSTscaffold_348, whole genome shotgun sequence n=1 Tax=Sphaerobolus stellatus (strain SS14) TaxID=990650 RepID=A0A0C9T8C7_SPHS4|nr:hypothetical protein M422DRAFT_273770 [Sphaerobolus stellatus SS14]